MTQLVCESSLALVFWEFDEIPYELAASTRHYWTAEIFTVVTILSSRLKLHKAPFSFNQKRWMRNARAWNTVAVIWWCRESHSPERLACQLKCSGIRHLGMLFYFSLLPLMVAISYAALLSQNWWQC